MIRPARPAGRPRGFTLLELLVCVSVAGLLAALILPAILHARAAARASVCQNRLKQIGLAVAGFETSHGEYPFGRGMWSFHTDLLPWLERSDLHEAADASTTGDCCQPENLFSATTLTVFQCPEDSLTRPAGPGPSTASFLGSEGVAPGSPETAGFIGHDRPTRVADVRDGLSNTAALAERLVTPPLFQPDPVRSLYVAAEAERSTDATPDSIASRCLELGDEPSPKLDNSPGFGARWCEGLGSDVYTHNLPPNRPSCFVTRRWHPAVTASSEHPGRIHLLTLGGDARVVGVAVSPTVWLATGTRAGDEAVTF